MNRFIRTASLASVIALLAAPSLAAPGNSQSQLGVAAASAELSRGDAAAAVIKLKNAVRDDPANVSARLALAKLYLAQGNAPGALGELEAARTRGAAGADVMPLLAQTYLSLGRARDVLSKASADGLSGAAKAAVLAAQARAHLTLDEPESARRLVDEALAAAPTDRGALIASAMLKMSDSKFPEAEADVDKALTQGDQPELLVLKGELRQKQQDLDGAKKVLDQAVAKFPNSIPARIQRATVNVARNQAPAVQDDVDWVLERVPRQPFALFFKAYLQANAKNYRDASQTLLGLPELLDRYTPAMFLLAEVSLHDGREEVALQYAERYLKRIPQDPQGLKLIARVHQKMRNPDRAVEILEPLAARFPADNALKLQLATVLLEAGRSQEAVGLFQQGLAADPDNANARLALAVGQLRAGQTDQAIGQIEKTVKADPSSLQANTLLVLTHIQLNQFDKAKAAAAAMVAANPSNANAHNLQGTVLLSAHDYPAARTAFQAALQRDPKFVPAALNLARVEVVTDNRAAARQWFQKVIALEPSNLNAYQGLANLALRENDVDAAAAFLKQAVNRDVTATEPRLRLVNMLLDRLRYPQALAEARELVNVAPQSPQAVDALARAQIAAGDVEGGRASYQRLAAQNADNAEAQRRLGRVLMNAMDKDTNSPTAGDARAAFDEAVKKAPDDITALADRIEFERRVSGPPAALALAKKYSQTSPNSVPRLIVLGDTQLVAGQGGEAVSTYKRVWEKSKSSMAVVRLYAALMQEGKGDEAIKSLKSWVATHPADYDVRFLVANHYLRSGQNKEAIAETEAISAVYPENPALLNNLAWLYAEENPTKAISMAERAYVLAPGSADVLDTLGWLNVSKADAVRGETLLQRAHQLAPDRADIGFHYAVALQKNNKSADAKNVLQKALAGNTQFAERAEAQNLLNRLR